MYIIAYKNVKKNLRRHTELNHGPIGLQPIALPLSYTSSCYPIPQTRATELAGCMLASVVFCLLSEHFINQEYK